MPKHLLTGKTASDKLLSGIDKLNAAVSPTLGAKGKTVIIGRGHNIPPQVTKDGVTVTDAFVLPDPIENLASSAVKQAAQKTAKVAGDGTTTATILAHAMITEGLRCIYKKGANPMDVKRGIDMAVETVVGKIKDMALPISLKRLKQISIVSANNDEVIGKLIADAFEKVGKDGTLKVEESKSYDTTIDIVQGIQIDKGFLSPYFRTDESNNICELINPYVLLVGQEITMMSQLLPLLNDMAEKIKNKEIEPRPLFIIADNLRDEALATLVVNHQRRLFMCCAISAPAWGIHRKELMEDIGIMTGATYILEEKGFKIENATAEYMGGAGKIIIEENRTFIMHGFGDKDDLNGYCDKLRELVNNTDDERVKDSHRQRLARLLNGVGIIRVGGATEVEVGEKKDRIDDSIRAIQAANEEGYVAGGGTTYLHCSKYLAHMVPDNKDIHMGVKVVTKAIQKPFLQILLNAGLISNPNSWRAKRLIKQVQHTKYGHGINLMEDAFCDLMEWGIVDPAKVARVALENAASVAGTILTTQVVLQEELMKTLNIT